MVVPKTTIRTILKVLLDHKLSYPQVLVSVSGYVNNKVCELLQEKGT